MKDKFAVQMGRSFPNGGMHPSVGLLKPYLFQIGGFSLHTFGVLVALGFLAGLHTSANRVQKLGFSRDSMMDLGPWFLISGLLGARLLYVVSYWQRDFAGGLWMEAFQIWKGGLVFYGGMILAILTGVWRLRRAGLPVWMFADAIAPGIALGHVFGRLGCFMNGCCYGHPSNLPWAVKFPLDRVVHGQTVHPTQIYEAVLNLGLCGMLTWHFSRRRFSGQTFSFYLIGYASIRFITELFRGDYDRTSVPLDGVLTPGQPISVLIAGAGLALWAYLRQKQLPTNPSFSVQPRDNAQKN